MATPRYITAIKLLAYCLDENVSLKQGCEHFGLGDGFLRKSKKRFIDALEKNSLTMAELDHFSELYNIAINRKQMNLAKPAAKSLKTNVSAVVDLDIDDSFDNRSKGWEVRDEKGRIVSYAYKILVRDELPISGTLTRGQMEKIYSEYPYTTLNNVSTDFPFLTLVDLKRILRTFNITKDRLFPAHIVEEHSEEKIAEFGLKAKEKSSYKKFAAQKLPFVEGKLREAQEEIKRSKDSQEWVDQLLEKYINQRTINTVTGGELKSAGINTDKAKGSPEALNGTTVAAFTDIHFGKHFPTSKVLFGRGTNKDILRERLLRMTEIICADANEKKTAKVVLVFAGDVFESIQPAGQRIQHTDSMDIKTDDQFIFGMQVFEEIFEKIKTLCPEKKVVFHAIGGNHDRLTDGNSFDKSRTAAQILYRVLNRILNIKYGDEIEVKTYPKGIISFSEGAISYIAHHGDAIMAKRTAVEIANLHKVGDAKNYTVILKGHLHNFKADWEYPNSISIQLKSICSSDEYSQNELGKGAQPGFTLISESEGYGVDFKTITLA